MVRILLWKFRDSTGAIPEKIIFYRDGVGESQFQEVLMNELSAIQKACFELKEDYKPAITFIVVIKRHHINIWSMNKEDQRGKTKNVPAGTVICLLIVYTSCKAQEKFLSPTQGLNL